MYLVPNLTAGTAKLLQCEVTEQRQQIGAAELTVPIC